MMHQTPFIDGRVSEMADKYGKIVRKRFGRHYIGKRQE